MTQDHDQMAGSSHHSPTVTPDNVQVARTCRAVQRCVLVFVAVLNGSTRGEQRLHDLQGAHRPASMRMMKHG